MEMPVACTKQLSCSAPPGCHPACPSLMLISSGMVAASEHHVVGSRASCGWQHYSRCSSGDVCVAWAHLRLTSFGLAVHLCNKSVMPSSQPEQNDLLCSVLFVKAAWLIEVWTLLLPVFLGEGFDDCLFIDVKVLPVLFKVQLAPFLSKPVCLFIS